MRPDRADTLRTAPLADLLAILLRQHSRLLAERQITLAENDMRRIADHIAGGHTPDAQALAARDALVGIVEESVAVLAQRNLTFAQSLNTEMGDLPGWETTAEFLEIANEKGNAELRIASGAALVAALGDLRYAPDLLAAIVHDPDEIEAEVARRVLSQASGIAPDAPDWQAQIETWLDQQTNGMA